MIVILVRNEYNVKFVIELLFDKYKLCYLLLFKQKKIVDVGYVFFFKDCFCFNLNKVVYYNIYIVFLIMNVLIVKSKIVKLYYYVI